MLLSNIFVYNIINFKEIDMKKQNLLKKLSLTILTTTPIVAGGGISIK